MVVKMGTGLLAHHERARQVKEERGYNIMKEQAFQEAIKSTFVLVNGGKIIKWWVTTIQMEALHDYGDQR